MAMLRAGPRGEGSGQQGQHGQLSLVSGPRTGLRRPGAPSVPWGSRLQEALFLGDHRHLRTVSADLGYSPRGSF